MVNLYLASVRPSMVRLISIPSKHIEVSQESYLFAESDWSLELWIIDKMEIIIDKMKYQRI